ncbi:unnamed protein product [Paramecium sonneborni]|uniref:Uncharacterized protein n=1 Tax=Paramecium sonneborni TaxID=65129 RepID=A0A8S1RAZ1_9CILI|nr:unnamed protein product [Paramecium sonneborni]
MFLQKIQNQTSIKIFLILQMGECLTINIDLPYVFFHFKNQQEKIYDFYIICQDEKQQSIQLDNPIKITVKAPKQDQIIKQLQDLFPQKDKEDLIKYVKEYGKNKSFDKLVEKILQE